MIELAAFAGVEKVDTQADAKPGEEPEPGPHRQSSHQQKAKACTQNWYDRTKRDTKATMASRVFVAQNEHTHRHQHESKQRTDVRHFGQSSYIEETRGNGY